MKIQITVHPKKGFQKNSDVPRTYFRTLKEQLKNVFPLQSVLYGMLEFHEC